MLFDATPVLIRGAGEHASAIAWHLSRAGFPIVMTELPEPLAVRREVAFSRAARKGRWSVEGITAQLCGERLHLDKHGEPGDAPTAAVDAGTAKAVKAAWQTGEIALVIDEGLELLEHLEIFAIIDARMQKTAVTPIRGRAPFTLAIGPGVVAGEQVDVVVETERGHDLGRIISEGEAAHDTSVPGEIAGETINRVYFSPSDGRFWAHVEMGQLVRKGDLLGIVEGEGDPRTVVSRIAGRVRGLIADGETIAAGTKIADVDPRGERIDPSTLSDKGRCITAGVMTALLEAIQHRS
jgi:xanthine dehydrogenase accessory factor